MVSAKQVLDAVGESDSFTDDPFTFTTQAGIKLKLKSVPPMLIVDAQKRIQKPKVPKVHLDDKEAWEENPSDPDYVAAYEEYERTVSDITHAIFLVRGTSVLHVPEGVETVGDPGWVEEVKEFAGLDVPEDVNSRKRYLCWLKYVAVASTEDFSGLIGKLMRRSGATMEVDVAQAADDFRSDSEGDAVSTIHSISKNGRRTGNKSADAGAGS